MMKRLLFLLFAFGMTANMTVTAAMSISRVREESRFLTDKMAYELRLNNSQIDDVYEINYDFVYTVGDLMDNVMYGQEWALEEYYEALDIRNDDLRWVLADAQYRLFLRADYFYRPIYVGSGGWNFRVHARYTNHLHFYFGKPRLYLTYCGGHYRRDFHRPSFYHGRHRHMEHYSHSYRIREHREYKTHRRSDFGSVRFRANTSIRPGNTSRPSAPNREIDDRREHRAPSQSQSSERRESSPQRESSQRRENNERRESSRRSESSNRSNTTRSEVSSGRRSSERSSSSGRTNRSSNSSRSSSSERGSGQRR